MALVGASEDFLLAVIANVLGGGSGDIAVAPAAGVSITRIAALEPTWEAGSEGDEVAYAKLYQVIVGATLPGKPPSSEVILQVIVDHLV